MILFEIVDGCIRAEVPATATRQDIEEFEENLHKFEPEAKRLPVNYIMIDDESNRVN